MATEEVEDMEEDVMMTQGQPVLMGLLLLNMGIG